MHNGGEGESGKRTVASYAHTVARYALHTDARYARTIVAVARYALAVAPHTSQHTGIGNNGRYVTLRCISNGHEDGARR